MADLPVEVLSQIFALACTDTGKTGCALSAVSHYVRAASAEYRYHAVAATTARAIYELRDQLIKVPPALRRIRHLHLNRSRQIWRPYPSPEMPEDERLEYSQLLRRFRVSGNDIELDTRIQDILELSASTLETLCVVSFMHDGPRLNVLHLVDFPRLRNLIVRGFTALPCNPSFAPNLEQLEVWYTQLHLAIVRRLAKNFPKLTHVSLLHMNDNPSLRPLVKVLKSVLAIPPELVHPEAKIVRMRGAERRLMIIPEMQGGISLNPLTVNLAAEGREMESKLALETWLNYVDMSPPYLTMSFI